MRFQRMGATRAFRPQREFFRWKESKIMIDMIEKIPFDGLKKNSDNMIPVIVQDIANDDVLMMAYMNKEAYDLTIETGLMHYYSRSRDELWCKGATSGHYQHLKKMYIDCDNDTILVKVIQDGAACHTGNRSCFYREYKLK